MSFRLAVFAVLAALLPFPAAPHGEAGWINNGRYLTAAGGGCCGVGDCMVEAPHRLHILTQSDTTITILEFTVLGEPRVTSLTKYRGWYPSIDMQIWSCRRAGGTSAPVCIFTPEIGG